MPTEKVILGLVVGRITVKPSKGQEMLEEYRQEDEIQNLLGPVATEFNDALNSRIERCAEETDSEALRRVASDWDVVVDRIDADEDKSVFGDEREALDWLIERVTSVAVDDTGSDVDTDAEDTVSEDEDREELREIIAEEYANALENLRNRVEEDEDLKRSLHEDFGKGFLRSLEESASVFRRLVKEGSHTLYGPVSDTDTELEEYERTVESESDDAGTRYIYATLLHKHGKSEEATEQYERAIEIDPDLAKAHYNYAVLLRNEGKAEEAKEHLEISVGIWMNRRNLRNALHDLRTLVDVCLELDDEECIVESCESALKILNRVPDYEDDDERRWFGSIRMLTRPRDVNTADLHGSALLNIKSGNEEWATELLEKAWKRYGEHDKESDIGGYRASMSAGVALASYIEISDDLEASWTSDEILAEIEADDLHKAPRALYDHMTSSKKDDGTTSEDLWKLSADYEERDQNLAATEAGAFAVLLDEMEEQNPQ